MHTLDEMLSLNLINPDQHTRIRAWVAKARTPEAILQMPADLWRAVELASVLMGFDRDVTQQPAYLEPDV